MLWHSRCENGGQHLYLNSPEKSGAEVVMQKMKAVVFRGINDLHVEEVPRPQPRSGEAVIRVTATTICGTDVHIVKGDTRSGLV